MGLRAPSCSRFAPSPTSSAIAGNTRYNCCGAMSYPTLAPPSCEQSALRVGMRSGRPQLSAPACRSRSRVGANIMLGPGFQVRLDDPDRRLLALPVLAMNLLGDNHRATGSITPCREWPSPIPRGPRPARTIIPRSTAWCEQSTVVRPGTWPEPLGIVDEVRMQQVGDGGFSIMRLIPPETGRIAGGSIRFEGEEAAPLSEEADEAPAQPSHLDDLPGTDDHPQSGS